MDEQQLEIDQFLFLIFKDFYTKKLFDRIN